MSPLERVLAAAMVVPFALGVTSADTDPDGVVEFRFADPDIVESSGLVARDGRFATVNDSGDEGRVFVVDPTTGRTVGETRWGEAEDVEALAPLDGGDVLVGDIGDNAAARDSVRLVRVPAATGERTVTPTTYDLTYPDGPVDAEALLVHPRTGEVLIATKGIFGGVLYAVPGRPDPDRTATLRALGDVLGVVTDGAFFPDGRHLVLRDYGRALVYSYPGLEVVAEIDLPDQQQGEGIAVDESGAVFVSSEGQRAPVLRIELPPDLQRIVSGQSAQPSPTETTLPRADAPDADPVSDADDDRRVWPWLLAGLIGLGVVGVLVRSLRPR